MEYLLRNISENIKNIRETKNLSLEQVSEQTGVSRSMLAQIEREEANPSIGTLGKIASGLRIDIKDLISPPKNSFYHLREYEMTVTKKSDNNYTVYTCFPFGENPNFEIYKIVIEANGEYKSNSHGENTREYISVSEGVLTIQTKGKEYNIKKDDMFRFDTDKEHIYINKDKNRVSFICIFTFK